LTKQARYLQITAATLVAAVSFAGLALSKPADTKTPGGATASKPVNDPAFHNELLTVAAQYKKYGKVDDVSRWGSPLCFTFGGLSAKARLSSSKDTATHGKKVYYVYAKDRNQYFNNEAPRVGQVLVKESWHPAVGVEAGGSTGPVASKDLVGLFVVMKLAPDTPGSDQGWVYGTVAPDGQTVTSAGRVQSCMECHSSASYERLFGLAK